MNKHSFAKYVFLAVCGSLLLQEQRLAKDGLFYKAFSSSRAVNVTVT